MVNFNELIITNNVNLYFVIERGKNGYYAESLESGKVKYISDLTNEIKFLIDDKIHTYSNKMNMQSLFLNMKKYRNILPSVTAKNETIKTFFRTVLPEYNEKRILIKTLRKLINYFRLIEEHNERMKKEKNLFDGWQTEYKTKVLINNKYNYV